MMLMLMSSRPTLALPHLLVFFSVIVVGASGLPTAQNAFLTPSASLRRSSPTPLAHRTPTPRLDAMHRQRRRQNEDTWRRFDKTRGDDDDDPLALLPYDRVRSPIQQRKASRLNARPADADEELASSSASSSSLKEILILVLPLLLVYVSNQWSRYSISYLVDFSVSPDATTTSDVALKAMNVDLGFDQSQYGLLASTAFTVLFALSSLIAGNLADKYDRKLLTLGSCAVWSLATVYTSQAGSYEEVLAARVVMGGACAFAVPAAYTLIADTVSRDKLALSNSIYGSGVYLGGALASLSLLLDEGVGWRGTLGVIGGFGAASAAAAGLLLPSDGERNASSGDGEEIRGEGGSSKDAEDAEEENGLVQNTRRILSIPRVRFLFLASFLRFCSGLMIGVWAAPYYKQAFPDNASEYAVVNAFIVGAMGLTSGILGGYVADGLGTWIKETKEDSSQSSSSEGALSSIAREYFDEQSIPLLLPIVGSTLAIPAWYLTTHTTTATTTNDAFEIAMFWLAAEYLVAECWFGPTISVLQSTVGAANRGTAQGLFVLTGAVGNLAPTLLGWVYGNQITGSSEASSSSSEALGNLLGWGVCAGYLLSAVFFAVSVRASGEANETTNKQN